MSVPALNEAGVDEDIASDWASIREKFAEVDAPEEAPAEPETPAEDTGKAPAVDKPVEDKPAADAAARDDSGRFKKLPKGKTAPARHDRGAPAAEVPEQHAEAEQAAARDTTRAPSTWRPTARAEWEKLSPAVRAEIHRRESDFMGGQAQLMPDARFGREMAQTIEPYRMLIESEGGNPAAAVKDLLNTAAILRTGSVQQKYNTFAQIAKRFDINLAAFGPALQQQAGQLQQQQMQQQFRDPRVDQLLQTMQSQDQQRAYAEAQQTEQTAGKFMTEVDSKGQPLRPYVNDVIDDMAALIPSIKAAMPGASHNEVLQTAYERAAWANPEVRALLQQQQQTESEAKRRADSQQRVTSARRASSANVPRRPANPNAPRPGTMDETLMATARELGLITS